MYKHIQVASIFFYTLSVSEYFTLELSDNHKDAEMQSRLGISVGLRIPDFLSRHSRVVHCTTEALAFFISASFFFCRTFLLPFFYLMPSACSRERWWSGEHKSAWNLAKRKLFMWNVTTRTCISRIFCFSSRVWTTVNHRFVPSALRKAKTLKHFPNKSSMTTSCKLSNPKKIVNYSHQG